MATRNYGLGSRDMKFAAGLLLSKLDISFSSRSGIGDRGNLFVDWANAQEVNTVRDSATGHRWRSVSPTKDCGIQVSELIY